MNIRHCAKEKHNRKQSFKWIQCNTAKIIFYTHCKATPKRSILSHETAVFCHRKTANKETDHIFWDRVGKGVGQFSGAWIFSFIIFGMYMIICGWEIAGAIIFLTSKVESTCSILSPRLSLNDFVYSRFCCVGFFLGKLPNPPPLPSRS